jgi:hypothetical protein
VRANEKVNIVEQMFDGLKLINEKDLFELVLRLKSTIDKENLLPE